MKLKRILCPVDFSRFSVSANFYGSLIAKATDAQLIFLSVLYPPSNGEPEESQLKTLAERLSMEVRPFIAEVPHEFVSRSGNPAEEILGYAKEQQVDLIVMGTHGTTGLTRLLHGSVCEKVLRKAECPVMAVKDSINVDWISHNPGKSSTSG